MKDYLIIGNSAAGISAAGEIRRRDPAGRITVLSDEPSFGYSRVLLPLYLAGKLRKREMLIAPRKFYTSRRVRPLRNDPAVRIDAKAQRVYTRSGTGLPYDSLLIATGASPRALRVPGENLRGVHYLRKISDAESILEDLSSSPGPVVLAGGGLVGVKSLEALMNRGRKIHLVVSSDRVLSQMLDKTASDVFLECLAREGVRVHLRTEIGSFQGKGRLAAALLSDGTLLPCCLAVVGKGVTPNVDFLQGTGIMIGRGVRVDQHLATNIPGIYAAGDVAEPLDLLQERNAGNAIWPVAVEGGRVAGGNMASEGSASLSAILRMNAVEVLGTRVISVGDSEGEQELRYFQKGTSIYRKLVFSGNRLSGFLLAGDIRGAGVLTSLIKNRAEISPSSLEQGCERGFSYAPCLRALGGKVQVLET